MKQNLYTNLNHGKICIILLFICAAKVSYASFRAFTPPKLPNNVVPLIYEITIEPEMDNAQPAFRGNVTIELEILTRTNEIVLHAAQLSINMDDITLKRTNGDIVPVRLAATDPFTNVYKISFEKYLEAGENYRLTIAYSGNLRSDNQGFYLAKYEDRNGTARTLATTFFTQSNARTAFPCFDEPALKAEFIVKIIRSKSYFSLSNEEKVNSEDLGDGRFLDTFKKTPKMSTYLVAFLISDFEHTINGLHRIFAKPQALDNGETNYILEELPQMLTAVEEYVGMNYTFSKMDHVAIPDEYFPVEGLENWGLISYSEKTLLVSNKTHITMDKLMSYGSVLHELIHQWFGNLVTPSDWKYLWLSEGLATYLQFRIGDTLQPSWKLLDQFQNIVVERAFEGELSFSRSSLNEDSAQWVAYLKGAAIFRMLENFVTPTVFRKGLQLYLKNNQFGSVQPADLYEALQTVADEENMVDLLGNNSIAAIMKTWDSAVTFPIVNVTRNYLNGRVTFEQDMAIPSRRDHVWYIPLNFVFNAEFEEDFLNSTADYWLTEKVQTPNKTFPTEGWMIVNKQFSGYYRVNYDLTNWNRLVTLLNSPNFQTIPVLNRAQLISDAFELAKFGRLPYDVPLQLSIYLSRERSSVPIKSFINAVEHLNLYLSDTDVNTEFKNYIFYFMTKIFQRLGLDEAVEENYSDKFNRENALKWLCKLGHSNCTDVALLKLRNWKNNATNDINPGLQESLLCGAMRVGNQEDWDFLYEKYETADNSLERGRILDGLSCSENGEIITGYLEKILDQNSTIRDGDRALALIAIIDSGNVAVNLTINYLRQNLRTFLKLGDLVEGIFNVIGSHLTTQEQYDMLLAFKNEYRGMYMILRPAMTLTRININWKIQHLEEVRRWFKSAASS